MKTYKVIIPTVFVLALLLLVLNKLSKNCDRPDVWGWDNTACVAYGGYVLDLNILKFPYVPFQISIHQRMENLYVTQVVLQYQLNVHMSNDGWVLDGNFWKVYEPFICNCGHD